MTGRSKPVQTEQCHHTSLYPSTVSYAVYQCSGWLSVYHSCHEPDQFLRGALTLLSKVLTAW